MWHVSRTVHEKTRSAKGLFTLSFLLSCFLVQLVLVSLCASECSQSGFYYGVFCQRRYHWPFVDRCRDMIPLDFQQVALVIFLLAAVFAIFQFIQHALSRTPWCNRVVALWCCLEWWLANLTWCGVALCSGRRRMNTGLYMTCFDSHILQCHWVQPSSTPFGLWSHSHCAGNWPPEWGVF